MKCGLYEWTIVDLAAKAALSLSEERVAQRSRRIRGVPSVRTIRFYSTVGLLSRPLRFDGRTALYGPRHLAQFLVIKKLQAQGLTLGQIHHHLVGLDESALRKLAGIEATTSQPLTPRLEASDERMEGARLDPQVLLLLEHIERPLEADDLQAMWVAAMLLLKLLRIRWLVAQ